ncbi:hypothetical protein [Desulfosoma caldarium]|uniref:Uncharacterized protein n=1 Tax=Desulfosoma caldarium TaxID=610254 RepID=A0A3N1VI21_9BACT|nr:hypothetical protein [Desulfosoma caldarium]ROR01689.1 hypothetical protein EDC27_0871 [Desulfosoma caldarium]
MVLVCHVPHGCRSKKRVQRLWALLCRWAIQEQCRLLDLAQIHWRQTDIADPALLGVMVASDIVDLSPIRLFRSRLPHGHLVVVIVNPHLELLVAVQRYSPCFVAVTERDDAAIPQVLTSVCRKFRQENLEGKFPKQKGGAS